MEVLRGELEGLSAKVDQVQASVPSALAPVQERIKHLQDSITQMQTSKLDAAVSRASLMPRPAEQHQETISIDVPVALSVPRAMLTCVLLN